MTSAPTISVSTISDVYHVLLKRGISPQELEKKSGICLADVENLDARVSIEKLKTIWAIASQYTGQEDIGLEVGQDLDPGRFSVVAQASFQCERMRDVLQMYARFFSIVNESANMRLIEEDDLATLEFTCLSPEYYSVHEMERMISTALARCNYLTGRAIRVREICFQHEQPSYVESYEKILAAPVKFSQEQTSIVFEKALLEVRVKHGNPYLLKVLTSSAEKLLRKVSSGTDVRHKVRSFIRRNLSDTNALDVERAAKALHMSRHTLYRKLKKEEVSFQSLVEEVRQREAERYLKNSAVSISEVAFLLGFSELSAFSRAFKRWTGESPGQFRSKASM